MCFFTKQTQEAQTLSKRFKAQFDADVHYKPAHYNGFEHPQMAIVSAQNPNSFSLSAWGLLPSWTTDKSFRKNTHNARLETLNEKPSYKSILQQRCLVPADGFYEWQWQDGKGKNKLKFLVQLPNAELYAYAGLWNLWRHPHDGSTLHTFSIITTEANALMAEIHNTKKRMPVIIHRDNEMDWLQNGEIRLWNDSLVALPCEPVQGSLW